MLLGNHTIRTRPRSCWTMAAIHRTRTVKSEIRMLRKVEIHVTIALYETLCSTQMVLQRTVSSVTKGAWLLLLPDFIYENAASYILPFLH